MSVSGLKLPVELKDSPTKEHEQENHTSSPIPKGERLRGLVFALILVLLFIESHGEEGRRRIRRGPVGCGHLLLVVSMNVEICGCRTLFWNGPMSSRAAPLLRVRARQPTSSFTPEGAKLLQVRACVDLGSCDASNSTEWKEDDAVNGKDPGVAATIYTWWSA